MEITREQLNTLIQYQTVDVESERIQADLEELPKRVDTLEAQLLASKTDIGKSEEALAERHKDYRQHEEDINTNQEMIRKSNEKLPSVKTNKEYHALLKEIETLKKKNSAIEDQALTNLNQIEDDEKKALLTRDESAALQEEIEQEKSDILAESQEQKEQLARLKEELQAIAADVPERLMKRFKQVRQQMPGLALVAAKNSVCQGCHLNIPPQMYNNLQRSGTLQFCPFCHRMIYSFVE